MAVVAEVLEVAVEAAAGEAEVFFSAGKKRVRVGRRMAWRGMVGRVGACSGGALSIIESLGWTE